MAHSAEKSKGLRHLHPTAQLFETRFDKFAVEYSIILSPSDIARFGPHLLGSKLCSLSDFVIGQYHFPFSFLKPCVLQYATAL
jgi:hypothetical protein